MPSSNSSCQYMIFCCQAHTDQLTVHYNEQRHRQYEYLDNSIFENGRQKQHVSWPPAGSYQCIMIVTTWRRKLQGVMHIKIVKHHKEMLHMLTNIMRNWTQRRKKQKEQSILVQESPLILDKWFNSLAQNSQSMVRRVCGSWINRRNTAHCWLIHFLGHAQTSLGEAIVWSQLKPWINCNHSFFFPNHKSSTQTAHSFVLFCVIAISYGPKEKKSFNVTDRSSHCLVYFQHMGTVLGTDSQRF